MKLSEELGQLAIRERDLTEQIEASTPEQQLQRVRDEAERLRADEAQSQEVADAALYAMRIYYAELSQRADSDSRQAVKSIEAAHRARKMLKEAWRKARSNEPIPPSASMKAARAASRGDHDLRRMREQLRDAANTDY